MCRPDLFEALANVPWLMWFRDACSRCPPCKYSMPLFAQEGHNYAENCNFVGGSPANHAAIPPTPLRDRVLMIPHPPRNKATVAGKICRLSISGASSWPWTGFQVFRGPEEV